MKIIISPYSQKLRGKTTQNPKNYPYWSKVISAIKSIKYVPIEEAPYGNPAEIIQIGVQGEEKLVEDYRFNLKSKDLLELLKSADLFISVDNFLPHMAHYYGIHGIVLWGKSDPEIFGYKENINLLKDRKHLRPDQFGLWESTEYQADAFVDYKDVFDAVLHFKSLQLNLVKS